METSFGSDATEAFRFLLEKQGCSVQIDADNPVVVFANDDFEFRLFREPGSYMIYCEVRCKDTGEDYLLHELLRSLAPGEELNAQCSGADEQKMKRCLKQLGQLCERHLQSFLSMDESTHKRVATSVESTRARYTLHAQYGAVKDLANQAWDRKDWKKARELYEEAKLALSPAEERRLSFLRKKVY
jgi:hypothetical protein